MHDPITQFTPRAIRIAILALCLGFIGFHATAAESVQPRGLRGVTEMEQFIDGIMAGQQESLNVVGAVVVVVANGQIYFAKGYGQANINENRQVDPDTTLFRIGSITKLFTATAVMQLWENEQLRLDANVNRYLKAIQVPATFPEPITLNHLLSHTAGFEDRILGLFSYDRTSLKPLVITLAADLPKRVLPPGQMSIYSNYGIALAGLLIQEISGMLWEEYVEKNILTPLEMTHSTVYQPVEPSLEPHLATGYRYAQDRFHPEKFEFVPIAPAGCISASGTDMGRFMIAHLQSGAWKEKRILNEDTARLMHSQLFANAPGINGMLHGFIEMNQNGERIMGHGGGTVCFHSLLTLLPDRNLGVFVAYNSDTGARARSDFWQAFLKQYFPAPGPSPKPSPHTTSPLNTYNGEYSALKRSFSTVTKLSALFWTTRVQHDPDGTLVTTGPGQRLRRWTEVGPGLFQEIHGTRRIAFGNSRDGRHTYLFPDFPAMAFARHDWYETRLLHLTIAGSALGFLLSALVFWPILAWYMKNRPIVGSPPRLARLSAWVMCLLFISFFAGAAILITDPRQFLFGVPPHVQKLLWLPLVSAFFVLLTFLFALSAWAKGYWSSAGRIHYSLVALAGATLLWWSWHWNLLGFHF